MRILATAAIAGLLAAMPALAQALDDTQAPRGLDAEKVDVVDLEDLPPEIRLQVNAALDDSDAQELAALRATIDATPAAATALKAKGDTSSDVIAANIGDDGQLTLITLPEV